MAAHSRRIKREAVIQTIMLGEVEKVEGLVTDWDSVPVEQVSEGIQRQMIIGRNMMICRFRFDPHVVTPEHTHPHEQMTFVMKGNVQFTIDGSAVIAAPGDVLHFPSNNRHGATMLDEEVVLIDVFSPVREDFLTDV